MKNETMKKPELLAPAGDFEKLQMAIAYGADAVYVGGKQFSLRANAKNFDLAGLREAVNYAHERGVRVYVGVNIFAHNEDFAGLYEYLVELKEMGADAVIVADLGVLNVARQVSGLEIHVSTQANVTNWQSALVYRELGASRVILARELSFGELREINDRLALQQDSFASDGTDVKPFETEAFVHGAMCVSYSGRCLLSNYMAGRDGNKGDCAQPCRWKYHLMEEMRPGEYIPVYEDERGTYLFNSKDMCMIEYIPELVKSGVSSFKIEGRMKTAYYVAMVTRIYREALDNYFTDPGLYESKKGYYLNEIYRTSHRDFITGFYMGKPHEGQNLTNTVYNNTQEFLGVVLEYDAQTGFALIEQRNKFAVGDEVEFVGTSAGAGANDGAGTGVSVNRGFRQVLDEVYDLDGAPVKLAPHPQQRLRVRVDEAVGRFFVMRR